MEQPSGNYRPQILVALIGMAGVLGAAALANWDKLTGTRNVAPAVAASPQPTAPPATEAGGAAKSAPDADAGPIPVAALPDISGRWRSEDGYRFDITQEGRDYSFQQYSPGGAWSGSGSGKLTGHKVVHDFRTADIAAGQCSGDVAPDGQSISGSCHDKAGGTPWGFRIDR